MFYITGTCFFRQWPEFTVGDILSYVLKLKFKGIEKIEKVEIFLVFPNPMGILNQKILGHPSRLCCTTMK